MTEKKLLGMRARRACAAVVSALGAIASAAGCEGRPRNPAFEQDHEAKASSASGNVIAEIDLSRGAPEIVPGTLFGPGPRRSHVDLVRALQSLDASETKGLFVTFGGASESLARAEEVGGLLATFRAKGMPVVCHADEYNNTTVLLAAKGCSEIWLTPSGGVESIGIAFQLLYANKFLQKMNVAVDYLQVGKYKGAEETFTRDGPSPEARQSIEGTLRGLRAAWLDGIAQGRGKKDLGELAEDGPWSADDAKARGFVDKIGYAEDAREALKKAVGGAQMVGRFGGHEEPSGGRGVSSIVRALSGSSAGGTPHVAVVPAVGAITMAAGPSMPWGSSDGITANDLGKVITRLTNASSVKAVVLRIDSPGGSALASDLLWKKLMKLRSEKPVVVSVGGMAASGGYYLACTGNKIVAEPTSIVGSIGVVGGKLSVGKALDDLGIHAETIAAAPGPGKTARASYLSLFSSWDDATKERVLATMTSIYDLFLKRVAEGRGTTVDKIAPHAEGRIFGGVDAKSFGLVDELGGYSDALRIARELAKLPEDAPVEIAAEAPGFFELLDGNKQDDDARASLALGEAQRAAAEATLAPYAALFERAPELRGFLGSIEPLIQGEHALAALPFGLALR